MGSGSRESIVASDHRNGSDPLFSRPKNSILNIKMMSPVFDVIHGWMPFIEENTNRMTFRGNARIFSTNFFLDNYFRTEGVQVHHHLNYADLIDTYCTVQYSTVQYMYNTVHGTCTMLQAPRMKLPGYYHDVHGTSRTTGSVALGV